MLDSTTGQRMRNFSMDVSNPYKRDKMMAVTSLSSINENGTLSLYAVLIVIAMCSLL